MRGGFRRSAAGASACAGSVLVLHLALTTRSESSSGSLLVEWLYLGLIVFATLACLTRWWTNPSDRPTWACLSLGLLAWTAGEVHHVFFLADHAVTPFPSLSDGFFVLFYPLCFVAVCLRVRGGMGRIGATLLLDGLIAATAACAVVAAITLATAPEGLPEDAGTPALIFNLAYPIGDLILVGAVAGGASLVRERVGRDFAAIGAGLILVATADALYLAQSLRGTYVEGSWIDSLWPAGLLAIAWGGWTRTDGITRERPLIYAGLPVAFSLAAVGILVVAGFSEVHRVSQVLATVAVLGVVARMNLALRENRRLLEASRREALADPLTGLANRRALVQELEAALERGTSHHLFIFDLDGFKHFNDTFGHPAGDELLIRLACALAENLEPEATPFRLGGDEFCVLVDDGRRDPNEALAAACAALSEDGDGYAVGASWGEVLIPQEAGQAADAVELADRRMYECKRLRKRSSDNRHLSMRTGV